MPSLASPGAKMKPVLPFIEACSNARAALEAYALAADAESTRFEWASASAQGARDAAESMFQIAVEFERANGVPSVAPKSRRRRK